MKASRAQVDLRAFRWPLQPLERKLQAELDAARARLAALRQAAREPADRVAALEQQWTEQARSATPIPEGALDPAAHQRQLCYLGSLARQIDKMRKEANQLGAHVAEAAAICLQQERKLAVVQKRRERAESLYAGEQLRRASKEADLAWLARTGCRLARKPAVIVEAR